MLFRQRDRDEVSRKRNILSDYSLSDLEFDFTGATKADEDYTEADTSLWPFTGPQPTLSFLTGNTLTV